jgi:hypothetical protein
VYITLYPPCLGYSSLIILLQPISFKPRHPPTAFSPLPRRRSISLLSGKINPSHLTTSYRIDSQIKLPRPPSNLNQLSPRLRKPVLIVKPPVRRYGVEMPKVNPSAMLAVSLLSIFIPFHVGVPLRNASHPRVKCVEPMPCTTLLSHGRSSLALTLGSTILFFFLSHCIGYADVPSPLSLPHVHV